jgi:hypothetical protein
MPVHRLFQNTGFMPEDIAVMAAAFESVCRMLDLTERSGPRAEDAARRIIECAQAGERDLIRLRDCALKALRE